MKLRGLLIAALLLTVPTAALAARGIVTDPVSLRAGPGTGFPVVDRIPGGAHVNIHGCLKGNAWCDISWDGDRGWVSSEYLQYYYRSRYVYLPDYVDVIDVPVVPFVLGTYWANYYSGRPFFNRRAYWTNYWQSHARFATRLPSGRSLGGAGIESRGSQRAFVNERGDRRGFRGGMEQGRIAHMNERRGEFAPSRRNFSGARESARFSGAPMRERMARPDMGRAGGAQFQARAHGGEPRAIGRSFGAEGAGAGVAARSGGAPLHSQAQMGAPRAMGGAPGGAPHAMGGAPMGAGGAPHAVGGAPHVGGGAPAGGPPGGGRGRPH